MRRLVEAVAAFAESIGGPGLFLIAFLDSSFLSFPQANDLLVVVMVLKYPAWMPYYAAMATLGSVAGCLVLYELASRGGATFLSKRLQGGRADRVASLIRRYGTLAVLVPSLLPPPAPFKAFVLMAGAVRVPRLKFLLAVLLGRGARYFGEGLLAVWYGEEAVDFLGTHGRSVGLALALVVVLGFLAYLVWRRTRQHPAPAAL